MELILLLGVTSSGKSDMAVELAKKLKKAVIISCDSRQVYKGLDLLSGKVEGKWVKNQYKYSGIVHYLIDIVELKTNYNLNDYISDYVNTINNLKDIDYVIVTGGTGLFARAIYNEYQLTTKIDNNVLKSLTLDELKSKLTQNDFNNSDWNNKIRLINKLSSVTNSKQITYPQYTKKSKYIIKIEKQIVAKKVNDRIKSRIKNGMIDELECLINTNSYDRMIRLGLESRYCCYYLLGMINIEELTRLLNYQTMQYIKRQLTWLNKEKDAIWIKSVNEIVNLNNQK